MGRGHSFLSTNRELLERYAACATSVEVIAVQQAYLDDMQAKHEQNVLRKGTFPPAVPNCAAAVPWSTC